MSGHQINGNIANVDDVVASDAIAAGIDVASDVAIAKHICPQFLASLHAVTILLEGAPFAPYRHL